MNILIIDDCPSRYDEFTKMLDKAGHKWIITCDDELVFEHLLNVDKFWPHAILLDHDMPRYDGRWWAKKLEVEICGSGNFRVPVIITSTTGLEGVREEMIKTLTARDAHLNAIINPADHINCELEWFWYIKGIYRDF
jgi:DNA-binding response OmpR family regulator